ncbi:MAG TPA: acyl carrier protein [Longimicrobiaceae bacterium]|nr:acyl carrier protein [Longimicrobiaceae bacterium]
MLTERVTAVIAAVKRIPEERITLDSSFEELGIDSLDGVEIVSELEEEFDISIPNEVAFEMRSVRDVVDSLASALAAADDAATSET